MAYAERNCGKIDVQTTWAQKEQIKSIPGSAWDDKRGTWTTRLSWAACVQLRGIFGSGLEIGPELRAWAHEERSNRVDPASLIRDHTEPGVPFTGNTRLRPFQQAGVQFLRWAGCAILGDDMGTGKTIQALETMRNLGTDESLPALVIAPKGVVPNWAREAKIWFPESVPYVVAGAATARRKILDRAREDPLALVLINYEAVRLHSRTAGFGSINLKKCAKCDKYGEDKESQCELHERELNTIPFKIVMADEAHRMKDPNSKQTRAIWAVGRGKTVERRIPMTGTLIANHAGELWALLHFVAPDEFPTKSKFVDRYCEAEFNRFGGLEIGGLRKDTKDELFKIIGARFRRMSKAQVLKDLPDKIPMTRYVTLSKEQRKAYSELEAKSATRLPDGTLLIPDKHITKYLRMMQLSSAMLENDGTEKGVRMCDPSPKLDVMEEILEDMDGKPIVFCAESRQLIDMASARLTKRGIEHAMIVGGIPQWDREAQLAAFQRGELQVLLFTMQAGGVGLTMTAADTICVLQWSASMILNNQSVDRVYRIGSEIHSKINVISIVAEGTIEEKRVESIRHKQERLDELNRDRERLEAAGVDVDREMKEILDAPVDDVVDPEEQDLLVL